MSQCGATTYKGIQHVAKGEASRLTVVTVETDSGAVWVAPKAAEQDWVLVVKRATQLDFGACAHGMSILGHEAATHTLTQLKT